MRRRFLTPGIYTTWGTFKKKIIIITATSLCRASCLGCQHDTARICCSVSLLGLRVRRKLAATIHIHHRHCYYYSARKPILIFTARCYTSAVLAMGLCLCLSVCPSVSVCLSQVGVLLKRLNGGSRKQHRTIPHGL